MVSSILICFCLSGCMDRPASDVPTVGPSKERPKIVTGHNGMPVDVSALQQKADKEGTYLTMKGMKLADYPSKTIGDAFDGYKHFTSREWKETRLPNMKVYLDFTGLQKMGVLDLKTKKQTASEGVDIKFVINPDGRFYVGMVSKIKIMSDGYIYSTPVEDTKKVLDAIFANKPLTE